MGRRALTAYPNDPAAAERPLTAPRRMPIWSAAAPPLSSAE